MTDKKGTLVWRVDHRPFGEASVDEDPDGDGKQVILNLRFPGQYFDKETGLHYNYFRDYHPGIGRYLEPDPIGFNGEPNLYVYASANPISNVDVFGLEVIDGMDCTEIARNQLPVLCSGYPYGRNNSEIWICTAIVVEDPLTCVCKYEKNIRETEYYKNYVTYEVTYKCIRKIECDEEDEVIVKKTESRRVRDIVKHWDTSTGLVRNVLGTTTAAFGGCSCALEGVGAVRSSL